MKNRGRKLRRGSAAVEMALVMPLLITLLLGIIQYGWVFMVRQALVTGAREGARTAALPGSTDNEIRSRVDEFLAPLGLSGLHVELTRATDENPIETVHVTVPYSSVSLVGTYFGSTSYNLGATCSMRKEGVD